MLDQKYNPRETEKKWQKKWEKEGIYKFDADSDKNIYSIDTPPPTLSGKMHMGHAFSYIQTDIIARYKRMQGKNVFYPFGTDDNGLPTERLVEKMHKVKGSKMERHEFIKLCEKTVDELRDEFVQDWKNIGISADFNLFYSTINDHCRRISQKSFIDLYKAGRIYRKKAPIIFCPQCKTAIAQVEMEDAEKETTLNYVKGKTKQGEYAIYATTRPELHPACIGISLDEKGKYVIAKTHNNERWIVSKEAYEKMKQEFGLEIVKEIKGKELLGTKVKIAYTQKEVELTHDISAKTEYGTGIVFYCSYGGLDCVEWLARHQEVKPVHIMDESGVYNELSPYKGMSSEEARKKSLEDLEKDGLLVKKERMKHSVNTHERCGTDIEYVATEQWFIRYLDLKEKFLESGNELRWHPEHMKNRYDNWVKGLQWDWCISRQRFFGVPFPLWYGEDGQVILAEEDQLPVDPLRDKPKKHKGKFVAEKDVLDTWATSSLTPQIAVELVKGTKSYNKLSPMSLRPQAHDIISFWLFNTIVKSQLHEGKNPWSDTMISGWALDSKGKKMSKSKGNVIEPREIMEKYSADILRFWAGGSRLGDDLWFSEKEFITGQRLLVKIWNASKFCLSHLDGKKIEKPTKLEIVDKWMLSKLNTLVREVGEALEKYEYSKLRNETNNLFWNTFCDYYLETAKDRLYNPDKRGEEAAKSARYTVHCCLKTFLKLFAPILPHITEEIYRRYYSEKSIHKDGWPEYEERLEDKDAEKKVDVVMELIGAVRKIKTERNLSLGAEMNELLIECSDEQKKMLGEALGDLKSSTRVKELTFGKAKDEFKDISHGIKVSLS